MSLAAGCQNHPDPGAGGKDDDMGSRRTLFPTGDFPGRGAGIDPGLRPEPV
jgi:hypothetical protein